MYAPASISNLGPAFDVLGVAIDRPGDFVTTKRSRVPGLAFSVARGDVNVPDNPTENVAAHVASLILEELKPEFGIHMELKKKMPLGSGLGSSAASSVAAAVAVNELLPRPLTKRDLLRFVVEGERKASGSPHADNAAPSLLGGVCLIRSYRPLDVVSVPVKKNIVWVVVHPHVIVRTEEARSILPKEIPLREAIQQWGNVSGLTMGLMNGDPALVGKCVEDVIVEPVRAGLIPGFPQVKQAALSAGAFGCSISGSGPSVFAVTSTIQSGKRIAAAMLKAFAQTANVKCDVYVSGINHKGAHVVNTSSR